jgi:hypothetical protein
MLQEHDTDDILEHLRFAVALEPLLADERADARDILRTKARGGHDVADPAGMKVLQVRAPFQVTGAPVRIAFAR